MTDLNLFLAQLRGVGQLRPVTLLPRTTTSLPQAQGKLQVSAVAVNTTTNNQSAIAGGSSVAVSAIVIPGSNASAVVGRTGGTHQTATLQDAPVHHSLVINVFKSSNKCEFKSYII